MIFASDNWAGASAPIMQAVADAAEGVSPAYGSDDLTTTVERRFAEVFDHDVAVQFVATGTAANALAIGAYAKPGGIVFGQEQAHIMNDEAHAVGFYGGGLQTIGLEPVDGKLTPGTLRDELARYPEEFILHGQPVAVSLTQINELGLAYGPDEVQAIAEAAKSRDMAVHMDGARFAGAVASLGLAPADITWKAGVDALSFGGTKNGCLAAEAVILFDMDKARDLRFARQRAGHGFSKSWFIAAQFAAYLENDHWLGMASAANTKAMRIAEAVNSAKGARLALRPDANEVFAVLDDSLHERLLAAGAVYYPWSTRGVPKAGQPGEGETLVRLVTSFATPDEDVKRFCDLLMGTA